MSASTHTPRQNKIVKHMREGDPKPPNVVHFEYSTYNLIQWFEARAVKTGFNLWRWE